MDDVTRREQRAIHVNVEAVAGADLHQSPKDGPVGKQLPHFVVVVDENVLLTSNGRRGDEK